MKKLILLAFAAATLAAGAKNLKADVSLDHNLWWEAPEVPCVKFTLTDTLGNPNRSPITVRLTTDREPDRNIMRFEAFADIKAGRSQECAFTLDVKEPGFYRCIIEDEGNPIEEFNIGYEPTLVVSLPDSKPDFDQFWAQALAELAQVPGNYVVEEDPEASGTKRKAYRVSMQSLENETVKGMLYVPVAPGKYPALIYFNGYGGTPWPFDVDGRDDIIEYVSSIRGQMYSQPDNHYGDWIRYKLEDPSQYYYRGAFMDVVRTIDFISQLEQVDTNNIFAEGGSQGGALTLVAGALDNRLNAIMPYIPFLNDYPDYVKIVPWPASAIMAEAQEKGLSDEQLFSNLSYFDVKNFVRRIECPVMMGIGLQDPVCPPHTNMASYALIKAPKELHIYPTCGHTVDYSDWNPRRDAFIKAHLK